MEQPGGDAHADDKRERLNLVVICLSHTLDDITFPVRIMRAGPQTLYRLKILSCSFFRFRNDSLGFSESVSRPL